MLGQGAVVLAGRAEIETLHQPGPGFAGIKLDRLLGMPGAFCVPGLAVLDVVVERRPPEGPAQNRMSARIARIDRERAVQQALRLLVVAAAELVDESDRADDQAPYVDIFGGGFEAAR